MMQSIKDTDSLKAAIAFLERKRSEDKQMMKDQFHETVQGLKPVNLLKSTMKDFTESPSLRGNLLNAALGITTGYLTKKVIFGASHNPVKRLLGYLIQLGVTNVVAKNSESIKSTGIGLLKKAWDLATHKSHNSNGTH